jgi:hypothetical protein
MKERFTLVVHSSENWGIVELNDNSICKAMPIRFFGAQETSNSFVISSHWIGDNSHKIWLRKNYPDYFWLWFPHEPSVEEERSRRFDGIVCCFNGREIDRWLDRYAGPLVTRLTLWIRFETI